MEEVGGFVLQPVTYYHPLPTDMTTARWRRREDLNLRALGARRALYPTELRPIVKFRAGTKVTIPQRKAGGQAGLQPQFGSAVAEHFLEGSIKDDKFDSLGDQLFGGSATENPFHLKNFFRGKVLDRV